MHFKTMEVKPGMPHLYGATLAEEHLRGAKRQRDKDDGVDTMLLLNFAGVLSVTPSYLKATILSVIPPRSGTLNSAEGSEGPKLYPAICGCSPDVAADIHEYLSAHNLPILHITKRRGDRVLAAKLFGGLDQLLLKTLFGLVNKGSATAAELAQDSDEKISVNGWNNRLADLHLLRLATRHRKGKFWMYSPVAERITTWA